VRLLLAVEGQAGVQILLHFLHRLSPFLASLDPEVLVHEGTVDPLNKAFTDPGGLVLDAFQLQEELIRVSVRPAAVLPAVVAEDDLTIAPWFSKKGRTSVLSILTAVTGRLEV